MFPGMVTPAGVIVKFPELLLPIQNRPSRLALVKVKGSLSGPPLFSFQITCTLETVSVSCGFVIVIRIMLVEYWIKPAVMLSQPATGVEVAVGVNVSVGVNVGVKVSVLLGNNVMVGVTSEVSVKANSGVSVGVAVAVGVSDGPSVGVSSVPAAEVAAAEVAAPEVAAAEVEAAPPPEAVASDTNPRIVRALCDMNGLAERGTNFVSGE